jgi:hypothetical protein
MVKRTLPCAQPGSSGTAGPLPHHPSPPGSTGAGAGPAATGAAARGTAAAPDSALQRPQALRRPGGGHARSGAATGRKRRRRLRPGGVALVALAAACVALPWVALCVLAAAEARRYSALRGEVDGVLSDVSAALEEHCRSSSGGGGDGGGGGQCGLPPALRDALSGGVARAYVRNRFALPFRLWCASDAAVLSGVSDGAGVGGDGVSGGGSSL